MRGRRFIGGALAAIATLCTAAGCSGGFYRAGYPSLAESPFYRLPVGSALTLTRPVTIAPGQVKTYFQYGGPVAAVNWRVPYCRLDVLTLAQRRREVPPGRFDVIGSRRNVTLAALADGRFRYAGRRLWLFDEDASTVIYTTELRLRSADYPDIHRLLCGIEQDPGLGARHLALNQIRAALGDWLLIEPG